MMHDPLLAHPATSLPATFDSCYLAVVVSVNDPMKLARVQVRLPSFGESEGQGAQIWARVAVPYAGPDCGAFLLPDVGDEVLVSFIHGDPRMPVVVGGLWNGSAEPPEQPGGSGDRIDRWTLVGKAGTRIAIVEEASGEPTISLSTPGGVSIEVTDAGGGRIECRGAGVTITVNSQGVTVQSPSKVKVEASQVEVTAGMVNVNAGISSFTGIVQCDTLIATSVLASTYTPGVGNIW